MMLLVLMTKQKKINYLEWMKTHILWDGKIILFQIINQIKNNLKSNRNNKLNHKIGFNNLTNIILVL